MANVEFGTGKTVVILSIVAACFAILWPKIFYPMITSISNKKSDSVDQNGCCDVIFETDINAFKIMTEICGTILNRQEEFSSKLSQGFQKGKLSKEIINMCRHEVMNKCGIDIAEFLYRKEKLGHSYKLMLDEIRSFNISICLRQNFGVNPGLMGAPRRMKIWGLTPSRHLRQERPIHLRPDIIHPALREKGRAIPQSHIVPKPIKEKDQFIRSAPVPGMRPPMGGAGHVVPPPKVGGTMSIVMPLYTIGIVIFFLYTVMKVFTKNSSGNDEFKDFRSDPEFRRVVFAEDYGNGCAGKTEENGMNFKGKEMSPPQVWKSPTDDSTRLGWKERDTIMSAITGLLLEVDHQLNREGDTQIQGSTEFKEKKGFENVYTEKITSSKAGLEVPEMGGKTNSETLADRHNENYNRENSLVEAKPKVKVVGLEMMAECEGGQKWSRPASPNLGLGGHSRPSTPAPSTDNPEPLNIFLEGALPQQSQVLVTDSKTQAFTIPNENEPEPPVILSSKMTLSLISLDTPLEDENINRDQVHAQNIHAKSDDDNLVNADSTLHDVDSEVIDETGEIESDILHAQGNDVEEDEGLELENASKLVNDGSDHSTNYITATMSGRAEAGFSAELEDTAADMSNLDGLDMPDDQFQENIQNEIMWNGNATESEVENQEVTAGFESQRE